MQQPKQRGVLHKEMAVSGPVLLIIIDHCSLIPGDENDGKEIFDAEKDDDLLF